MELDKTNGNGSKKTRICALIKLWDSFLPIVKTIKNIKISSLSSIVISYLVVLLEFTSDLTYAK